MRPRASLTEAPVLRSIAGAGLANLLASVILVGRNLLDGFYAAAVSTDALASFTLVIPIIFLLIGLSQGVSVAASNVLATRTGAGTPPSPDFVRHAAFAALTTALALGLLLAVAAPAAMSLYRADPEVLDHAVVLARWLIAGMPVLFLYGVSTAMLRALGDAPGAAKAATAGLLVGVAATPLLVFVTPPFPDDPLVGIALGLQLGYACTTVLVALRLRRRGLLGGRIDRATLRADLSAFARLGVPVALTNLVTLGAAFLITGVVSNAGTDATAAYGVVSRVDQFALIVVNSVILALVPFVGQNFGAGRPDRVRQGVLSALALMLGCWVLLGTVLALAAPAVAELFGLPGEAAVTATGWLRLSALAFIFQGVTMTAVALLQVLGRPGLALVANAVHLYALLVPWLFLLASGDDPAVLYQAVAGAQITTGVAFLLIGAWVLRRRTAPGTAVDKEGAAHA
ncbi:MatE-like domain efflux pump [Saccharothrix espanaensis DSM 44229]|uniref:MatE-like domain efflux pump n=1 Tax=Saccharothrix espanaensis (strain ATCC 51144 / DSM 44229 / JCM 9112 / NBRC 15066 / NRRL 15764) TaxID=1179773 RepID=K0K683_SACES|nr:MatE-like domain efflux pump [Saccharothrix espanaensis DSM 44229]